MVPETTTGVHWMMTMTMSQLSPQTLATARILMCTQLAPMKPIAPPNKQLLFHHRISTEPSASACPSKQQHGQILPSSTITATILLLHDFFITQQGYCTNTTYSRCAQVFPYMYMRTQNESHRFAVFCSSGNKKVFLVYNYFLHQNLIGFRVRGHICVQVNNKPPCELVIS